MSAKRNWNKAQNDHCHGATILETVRHILVRSRIYPTPETLHETNPEWEQRACYMDFLEIRIVIIAGLKLSLIFLCCGIPPEQEFAGQIDTRCILNVAEDFGH